MRFIMHFPGRISHQGLFSFISPIEITSNGIHYVTRNSIIPIICYIWQPAYSVVFYNDSFVSIPSGVIRCHLHHIFASWRKIYRLLQWLVYGTVVVILHPVECYWRLCWHIEAATKWTPFRRRHFQVHFHKWKCLISDQDCTEVRFLGSH